MGNCYLQIHRQFPTQLHTRPSQSLRMSTATGSYIYKGFVVDCSIAPQQAPTQCSGFSNCFPEVDLNDCSGALFLECCSAMWKVVLLRGCFWCYECCYFRCAVVLWGLQLIQHVWLCGWVLLFHRCCYFVGVVTLRVLLFYGCCYSCVLSCCALLVFEALLVYLFVFACCCLGC